MENMAQFTAVKADLVYAATLVSPHLIGMPSGASVQLTAPAQLPTVS
jgi:hypothetical protein